MAIRSRWFDGKGAAPLSLRGGEADEAIPWSVRTTLGFASHRLRTGRNDTRDWWISFFKDW